LLQHVHLGGSVYELQQSEHHFARHSCDMRRLHSTRMRTSKSPAATTPFSLV